MARPGRPRKKPNSPFNLEWALAITAGRRPGKIMTRDGSPARIICADRKGCDHRIVALVTILGDYEIATFYTAEGKLYSNKESGSDLLILTAEYLPVYDPGTLVLVRDSEADVWEAAVYDYTNPDGLVATTSGKLYKFALPLNNKTKRVLGTNIDYRLIDKKNDKDKTCKD